jgi:hypothetical protein
MEGSTQSRIAPCSLRRFLTACFLNPSSTNIGPRPSLLSRATAVPSLQERGL